MARCYTIDVDGAPIVVRWSGPKPPTDQEVEELREYFRTILSSGALKVDEETAERQRAARERARERSRRLLEEDE